MDSGVLFLVIVGGVCIGGYLKEFLMHHTAHLWVDQEGDV